MAYEATRLEVMTLILEPAEKEIEAALNTAGFALDSAMNRRLRFDQTISQAVADARSEAKEARRELSSQVRIFERESKQVVRDTHSELESVAMEVLKQASVVDVAGLVDVEFAQLRSSLEMRVRAVAATQVEEINAIIEQISSIVWSKEESGLNDVSLIDQVEQLETHVEALTERAAQDFELVQIGMAVNIVTHEFENSIRSVRDNLRRLKTWAQQNSALRPLYSDLRASFDHLDGYLKLFTPLHRRLYREPVEIRGSDVQRYLHDVFDSRLDSESTELRVSEAFEQMSVHMYPSTLYPVIVNLVDNAAYWLSTYNGDRVIELDKTDTAITITDSGKGISLGDEKAIFDLGFSRKPMGSGYGLYVAREVLRRDGADIQLAPARADRGARFEILLPEVIEE